MWEYNGRILVYPENWFTPPTNIKNGVLVQCVFERYDGANWVGAGDDPNKYVYGRKLSLQFLYSGSPFNLTMDADEAANLIFPLTTAEMTLSASNCTVINNQVSTYVLFYAEYPNADWQGPVYMDLTAVLEKGGTGGIYSGSFVWSAW